MKKIFILLSLSSFLFATETSFWRSYNFDDSTYILLHFDEKDSFNYKRNNIRNIEKKGEIYIEKEGKFGECLKLNGDGVIKYEIEGIFAGGFISIEAWIKLEKYPEDKAYIIYRPAVVDGDHKYNPEIDKTKGFSLYIDSKGAFHLTTTNCRYGSTTITSSPEGIIPLNTWVHIAGISAVFPVSSRKLYLNGKEVTKNTLEWGQGLIVYEDEEKEPGPIYVGNNDKLDKGFIGLIDEVRIHKKVFKFWEKEDLSWADIEKKREIPKEKPYFLKNPFLYLSLDETKNPDINEKENLKIFVNGLGYIDGVRGKGYLGQVLIKGEKILNFDEGTVEFWIYPYGINNWSDWNIKFIWTGWGFNFYIFNGGQPHQPLSLNFRKDDNSIHFINCPRDIDVYEGKWYQFIITWKEKEINIYIDGKRVAKDNTVPIKNKFNNGFTNEIGFDNGIIDEIYLYDYALTEEEVNNAYWRYKEYSKLINVQSKIAALNFQIMPGLKRFYYEVVSIKEDIEDINIVIENEKGDDFLNIKEKLSKEEKCIDINEIPEGNYEVILYVKKKGEEDFKEVDRKSFVRKKFIWENNNLGITDKVYSPFEPVKVENDNIVKIVLREYYMNGFGLFDKVITKGRDILAEPIVIKGKTKKGEIKWKSVKGRFIEQKDAYCIYEGLAESEFLDLRTKTTIEFDGCAKIELEIEPTGIKEKIENLYIEIPLKEKEISLFHEITAGTKVHYAGYLPKGEGIIWDSSKAKRWESWLNNFVSYIWLGKEERGLAWFGENDKGYITEKNSNKPNETRPVQEIERKEGKVVLRVYLINIPVILENPTKLVFGIQASPTKPMPTNWRKKLPYMPESISVSPWGGLHCGYHGPYRDDWEIVNKIIEARYKGKVDENIKEWFAQYDRRYNPPPVHGTNSWLSMVFHFLYSAAKIGIEKPIVVYSEAMETSVLRNEWRTYQDEWTNRPYLYKREWPDENILWKVHEDPSERVVFSKSYQDFGVYFANEWLKRGIGLYWDNTFPHVSYNYRTTDAYKVNNEIQPCVIIWNQREYQKRIWNQLCYWKEKRSEPLEWVLHMTTTLFLPLHTFGTANLDLEFHNTKPFPPDLLRTETIGLQVGNYPLSLYSISGSNNETVKNLTKEIQHKIEWGMRMVHEIQRRPLSEKIIADLDKIIFEFGYGEDKIEINNYWSETPIVEVNNENVKWIGLIDREKREILIIFASWSEKNEEVEIKTNEKNIGFKLKGEIIDVEINEKLVSNNIRLYGPYGVRIVKIN
ncbi:MAG: LamG domain-containing protein [Candidatus Omnitrophica bacterium]|nr:LamG domain-containing protein [Candidatus Omnitrophota bacterium]